MIEPCKIQFVFEEKFFFFIVERSVEEPEFGCHDLTAYLTPCSVTGAGVGL